jgi:hypothetical protein
MRNLLLILLLLISVTTFSQQGFAKKIIIVKIYNDSTCLEESKCFPSSAISIVNIDRNIRLNKFKNYNAYVVSNAEFDSLEINFLSLRLPLSTLEKNISNDFVFEFSIYMNFSGEKDIYSLSYLKGAVYRDKNYKTSFYKINLNFPQLTYSEIDKKFISNTASLPAEILNENIDFFFIK